MQIRKQSKVSAKPLIFGTAYYPDHWPEADWAWDLDFRTSARGF